MSARGPYRGYFDSREQRTIALLIIAALLALVVWDLAVGATQIDYPPYAEDPTDAPPLGGQ